MRAQGLLVVLVPMIEGLAGPRSIRHGFLPSIPLSRHSSKQIQSSSTILLHKSSSNDEKECTRRKLLGQTLLAGISIMIPCISKAATLSPDLAKITTAANRKVGGLSGKIRNIANVMVGSNIRIENFSLDGGAIVASQISIFFLVRMNFNEILCKNDGI